MLLDPIKCAAGAEEPWSNRSVLKIVSLKSEEFIRKNSFWLFLFLVSLVYYYYGISWLTTDGSFPELKLQLKTQVNWLTWTELECNKLIKEWGEEKRKKRKRGILWSSTSSSSSEEQQQNQKGHHHFLLISTLISHISLPIAFPRIPSHLLPIVFFSRGRTERNIIRNLIGHFAS